MGKVMDKKVEFTAIDPRTQKPVAQVVLNGYNIQAGGPLGNAGPMRSFEIKKGSLYSFWTCQTPILLKHENGMQIYVRVAALPVEHGGMGLLEALGRATNGKELTSSSEPFVEDV